MPIRYSVVRTSMHVNVPRREVFFGLIAALLGCVLLALAVPRTVAAWTALDGRPAISKLENDARPNITELQECVAGYENALSWTRASRYLAWLGSCEYEMALGLPLDDPARAEWLSRADFHTAQSLIENPADGFAWSRLSYIRMHRGAPARDVVTALIMSLDTAPHARPLWRPRSRLLLLYAPNMTVDELFTVRHQLRTIWTMAPNERPNLLEAAHTYNRAGVLIWALGEDREAIDEYETMERNTHFP